MKPEFLFDIREILSEQNPSLRDQSSIEINLGGLSNTALRKLERYTKTKSILTSKHERWIARKEAKIKNAVVAAMNEESRDHNLTEAVPTSIANTEELQLDLKKKIPREDDETNDNLSDVSYFTDLDRREEESQKHS